MYNLSRGLHGEAGVQRFFNVLHDLWCAHKAFREPRTANRAKSKPPPTESSSVNSNSRLPDIVEATLAAKLSDPDEPMRVRDAIQHLHSRSLFDISMIPFLQNILQRVSSFNWICLRMPQRPLNTFLPPLVCSPSGRENLWRILGPRRHKVPFSFTI